MLTNCSSGRVSRIRDQLLSRDDLRTRSAAASADFRRGKGTEQPESGARTVQMITTRCSCAESVRRYTAHAQSPPRFRYFGR